MKKNGLIGNLIWKFAERISAQLVSFIVSILLARLLTPEDYGVVAIVMIFISFANVFVSDGFGSALIQKKNVTSVDFYSVLYFNLFFSIALYFILFLSAPLISDFYGSDYQILTPVLRVLALRLPLTAVNSLQQAYISKKMMFRKFFLSTLSGTVLSAIVGISMAYNGFGVWALVAQYLVSTTTSTIVLAIVLRKLPRLVFSFKSLKELFPFGIRILGVGILITGYQEMRALIIGKMYSSADLAFYNKGRQFPSLIVTNINTSIASVLFPKMSNEQDNNVRFKETMRNSIRFSSFIMSPMMLGLAAVAEPFVKIVLTEKWLPCVHLLQVFCVIYLFQPIHTANMQAIKAVGRGDVYFKLEVVKKVIELIGLISVMWISVDAIVISMTVTAILFVFVNAYPNVKLLNYSIKEQASDLLPNIVRALIMVFFTRLAKVDTDNDFITLAIQVLVGVVSYLLISIITKSSELIFIKNFVFKRLVRKF